jgi:hypothetical protein
MKGSSIFAHTPNCKQYAPEAVKLELIQPVPQVAQQVALDLQQQQQQQ